MSSGEPTGKTLMVMRELYERGPLSWPEIAALVGSNRGAGVVYNRAWTAGWMWLVDTGRYGLTPWGRELAAASGGGEQSDG